MAKSDDQKQSDQRTSAARAPVHATPEVMHGVGVGAGGLTEDQKRAEGIDEGADAGPHDDSPEANRGTGGALFDTYAHAHAEHPNVTGPTAELVLGQAPVVPARPMPGSDNEGEQVDMDIPNAINQSPRIVGRDFDPRNDPHHPEHDKADKNHPDYGKPGNQHRGVQPDTPTFRDLKPDNDKNDGPDEAERKKSRRTKAADEGKPVE